MTEKSLTIVGGFFFGPKKYNLYFHLFQWTLLTCGRGAGANFRANNNSKTVLAKSGRVGRCCVGKIGRCSLTANLAGQFRDAGYRLWIEVPDRTMAGTVPHSTPALPDEAVYSTKKGAVR